MMNRRLSYLIIFILVVGLSSRAQTGTRNDAGLQGDAGATSGFFETSSPINYPAGASSWWHLLDVRHSATGNNFAMQLSGSFFDQNFYVRKTQNNAQQPWLRLLTESNGILSSGKLHVQTAEEQSFFIGRQLGGGYSFGDGIFRAITDNPNGQANYYFDGLTAGNRLFSIRADGEGYFAGRIGIGTPTPLVRLHVRKINAFSDASSSNTTVDNLLLLQTTYTGADPANSPGAGYKWGIQFWGKNEESTLTQDKSAGIYAVSEDMEMGYNRMVGIALHTSPFDLANREVVRISANGRMGVGTTTPREKLDIWGGKLMVTGEDHNGTAFLTSRAGVTFLGNNSDVNGIAISQQGNIGIGTSTPEEPLELRANQPVMTFHQPGIATYKLGVAGGTFRIAAMDNGYGGHGGGFNNPSNLQVMTFTQAGNLGIGTLSPIEKLTVNGKVRAREIRVDGQGQPDYVFKEGYHLMSLSDTEHFIIANGHLPEVPSAEETLKEGLELGEMNRTLLKKIEELTLQLIKMDKKMSQLQRIVKDNGKVSGGVTGKITR